MKTNRLILLPLAIAAVGCVRSANDSVHTDPPIDESLVSKPLRQLDTETAAEACVATARELVRANRENDAIEQYERARRHQPGREGIARELAVLYDREGRDELARREYERALREEGRVPELLNDLGYFHLQRGQLDEAERTLRDAVRADPSLEHGWMNLGIVLAEQHRYDEARTVFAKVVSPAAAEHNTGVVLARHGDYAAARTAFTRAAELDPGMPGPRELLAQLPMQQHGAVRLASFDEDAGE